jgi:transposase
VAIAVSDCERLYNKFASPSRIWRQLARPFPPINRIRYNQEDSITSEVVIHCIDDFCKQLQGPTVIVTDNASIHTSKAVQGKISEWEEKGLDIFYLPEYSPELNLIEILWRFMKYEWIEFWTYAGWDHLVKYVEGVIKNYGGEFKINFV